MTQFPKTLDLSENAYHESLRRGKRVLDCYSYLQYLADRDDISSSPEAENEIVEHYEWFERVMPGLIPWLGSCVVDLLTSTHVPLGIALIVL